MKITYAGQIGQPAVMRLERAEGKMEPSASDLCCHSCSCPQECAAQMDAASPPDEAIAPAPSPPALREDAEGWIAWDGGDYPPVPHGTIVEVRGRTGQKGSIEEAENFNWTRKVENPIYAYRLVPQ